MSGAALLMAAETPYPMAGGGALRTASLLHYLGGRYDVAVIEHFWCAPYWPQIAAVCPRTVLDLHNIESVLHERCAGTEGRAAGFAHRRFCDAARKLERIWIPRFHEVLVTSEEDAA